MEKTKMTTIELLEQVSIPVRVDRKHKHQWQAALELDGEESMTLFCDCGACMDYDGYIAQ